MNSAKGRIASVLQRLRAWFGEQGLHTQINLALFLGTLLILASVALPLYLVMRSDQLETAAVLLHLQADRHVQKLELSLTNDITNAHTLSTNTFTVSALSDSAGREVYFLPLLRNQRMQLTGGQMILTDYRGRPISWTGDAAKGDYYDTEIAQRVLSQGKPLARIQPDNGGHLPVLTAYFPVISHLTDHAEGMLIYKQPLDRLLHMVPVTKGDYHYMVKYGQQHGKPMVLVGDAPAEKVIELSHRLILPPPLDELQLVHVEARSHIAALQKLSTLTAFFVGGSLLLIMLIQWGSKKFTALMISPLAELASLSENIARTGMLRTLETSRPDEFGRLIGAFNKMVRRLQNYHDELEQRILDRTWALSKNQARLCYVLEVSGEGMWDWDLRTGEVIHNPQWNRLLGLDVDSVCNTLPCFRKHLHPDDSKSTFEAIQACLDGKEMQYVHEHRMLKADGTVIWVLDRGNVVERDADGKPLRMAGCIQDISERKQSFEEIRKRELYLRATLDNLPFLFWLKDHESRFLTVNREFSNACGRVSPEEVVGLTDFDVWPADLAEHYRADDMEVLASGCEKAVEEPLHSDEGRRWIETYKKAVIAEDGSVLGTVGFARDITARKEMEHALAESEQRWQLAVNGAKDGIFDWNILAGELVVSAHFKSMLGYSDDELDLDIGSWRSLLYPADQGRVEHLLARHLDGESAYFEAEFRMRCKDGSYKWILSRGRALFDGDGKPVRMAGSHTDISEKYMAELAVRERTMQLTTIFNLSLDGLLVFDASHKMRFSNASFVRITGLAFDKLRNGSLEDLSRTLAALATPDKPFLDLQALLEETRAKGAVISNPAIFDICGEHPKIVQITLGLSDTREIPIILFMRDITKEAEVERMKSEFLSTAAHELRTPMASIKGFSELLLHEGFDEETRQDMLKTISGQSDLMTSLLNELLDLARIEARRGKDFKYERTHLAQFLAKAVLDFHVPAGRQPVVMEKPGQEVFVSVDVNKLSQVVGNVLSNAYKYSPQDSTVTLNVLPVEQHRGTPMTGFRVSDSGIGMTPAQLSRAFERFYRADTSGKFPGTGLGLSIVNEIINIHNGFIHLDSKYGQGTSATIWLPLVH